MIEALKKLEQDAKAELDALSGSKNFEEIKIKYLGR